MHIDESNRKGKYMFIKRRYITYFFVLIVGVGACGSSEGIAFANQAEKNKSAVGYTYQFKAPEIVEQNFLQNPIRMGAYVTNESSFVAQIKSNPVALTIYRALESNIELLKTGTKAIPFTVETGYNAAKFRQDLQTGIDAFDRDYSEVFWVDITKLVFYSSSTRAGGKVTGEIRLAPGYSNYFVSGYSSQVEIVRDINRVNAVIKDLAAQARALPNDYDRVKFFHDYIIEKNEYNRQLFTGRASEKAWEITSALYYGSTDFSNVDNPVCEGYSRSLKVLCDAVGIPNVLVSGSGGGEAHMWNYIQLGGKWYAVDATWDDPIYSSNKPSASQIATYQYKYFLKGSADFPSHISSGQVLQGGYNFSYPKLSTTNYDPKAALISNEVSKVKDAEINETDETMIVKIPTVSKVTSVGYKKTKNIRLYNLEKDAKITYKSSNKKIVHVFSSGKIKGMKKGKATITMTITQGGKKFKLQMTVTCK